MGLYYLIVFFSVPSNTFAQVAAAVHEAAAVASIESMVFLIFVGSILPMPNAEKPMRVARLPDTFSGIFQFCTGRESNFAWDCLKIDPQISWSIITFRQTWRNSGVGQIFGQTKIILSWFNSYPQYPVLLVNPLFFCSINHNFCSQITMFLVKSPVFLVESTFSLVRCPFESQFS